VVILSADSKSSGNFFIISRFSAAQQLLPPIKLCFVIMKQFNTNMIMKQFNTNILQLISGLPNLNQELGQRLYLWEAILGECLGIK
jgi:hypothetical protein